MTRKLSQYGSFSSDVESLVRAQLLAEFSEVSSDFDFAACRRPDGSIYGISAGKKCRKGTETTSKPKPKLKKKKKEGKLPEEKSGQSLDITKIGKEKAIQEKKEEKGESRTQSAQLPLDRAAIEKNISRVETRTKEQLEKAKADLAVANRIKDENRRYDAKLDAEDRVGEAERTLVKIKLDREALTSGELDRPVKQFSAAQSSRIEAQLKRMSDEHSETGKPLSNVYYDLVKLRDARDPQAMAEYLKEDRELIRAFKSLPDNDPKRAELRERVRRNEAKNELAKLTTSERFSNYITTDGMAKMLDSSASSKQNAAHRDSAALFTVNHGELGDSKMAQSLIKKYKGDTREVQQGIDDVISFTQNSYTSIRRGVVDKDPTYTAQANRINTMIDRLPHPEVAKYRGIVVDDKALEAMVSAAQAKKTFADPAPSSWSTSASVSYSYAQGSGQSVIFETKNKKGASVENWGQTGEKEILTPGNTKYRYTNYRVEMHEGKQIHVFTTEED
jgi:hypothetical protein